jgi:hypothetical protein
MRQPQRVSRCYFFSATWNENDFGASGKYVIPFLGASGGNDVYPYFGVSGEFLDRLNDLE